MSNFKLVMYNFVNWQQIFRKLEAYFRNLLYYSSKLLMILLGALVILYDEMKLFVFYLLSIDRKQDRQWE